MGPLYCRDDLLHHVAFLRTDEELQVSAVEALTKPVKRKSLVIVYSSNDGEPYQVMQTYG